MQPSRLDLRIWLAVAPTLPASMLCDWHRIGSDSNTQQMDVDNSETDSDYNPDPNDLVNFVADMYQTPGPGAGQHGPICYGWERGCTCHGCLTDTAWHGPQNGTQGITNHANGQDMLLEHKQRQDAPGPAQSRSVRGCTVSTVGIQTIVLYLRWTRPMYSI